MLKQMKPHTDPLSPDNLLIFAPGVLTGAQGEAEAGGWWGPELKKAGFDAIIIKGSSSTPVYLYIKDGKIEIGF